MDDSESTDSDEKRDRVPEMKTVEDIIKDRARRKRHIRYPRQKKRNMHPMLLAEVRSITARAKQITIHRDWRVAYIIYKSKRKQKPPSATRLRAQYLLTEALAYLRRGYSLSKVDPVLICATLKRKGGRVKKRNDVDLEDMETDIEEGCKTTKKRRKDDDDDDKDMPGSGSGAAAEPCVTQSSSSSTVNPV